MSVNFEALVELNATKAVADDLAERIRKEQGLEARVGSNGKSGYSAHNGRFSGSRTTDNEKAAQRTIIVTGTSPIPKSAEQALAHLKSMLRRYSAEVRPTLAAYYIDDGNTANIGQRYK